MRFDEKHRQNLSKALKGRKLSKEHKQKLREAKLKNPVRFWLGKKRSRYYTKAWREHISKGMLRAYAENRRTTDGFKHFKENNPNKGKFGENHPCYKKVKKHPFYKLIRETYKYRDWRKSIFERDNYTCVSCKIKGGYLEADHYPTRFIEIIDKFKIDTLDKAVNCVSLWDMNNGRTLCHKCHRKTLSWGKRLSKKNG